MRLSYSRCPNKRGGLEPKPIAQTNPNSPRTGNDAGVKRNKKDKYCRVKYFFVIVTVICLPTEHLGVLKSLLKRVHVPPDRIRISKCWFLRIGKTGVPGDTPLGAKERRNNKLNPHMAS